jgi:hypothetical protein
MQQRQLTTAANKPIVIHDNDLNTWHAPPNLEEEKARTSVISSRSANVTRRSLEKGCEIAARWPESVFDNLRQPFHAGLQRLTDSGC